MRTKTLLLLLLLSCGVLNAQDTIKTLVITEARLDDARHSYVEITNMGTTPLNLDQFEMGIIGAWSMPYLPGANLWFMLPERVLAAGESFVVAGVYDFNPKMWVKDPDHYQRILNKKEFWTLADIKLHFSESPIQPWPGDSVTPYANIMGTWNGRDCIYLRHHVSATDSVVIDQVNGIFDGTDGQRANKGAVDVAGVTQATNNATLVRKFSVKQGNLDFETGRGQDLLESEWIPIPLQLGHWEMMRSLFWTVGNHGDYNIDPVTITSATVDIDWDEDIITVPWGVRNDDSIMSEFAKKPGIAWHYAYAPSYEDSAYISVRDGDILTLYACGNDMDMREFTLKVAAPTEDANWVIPMNVPNEDGFYAGTGPWFMVSAHKDDVMDTIQGSSWRGVGFATRVDSLYKYLEKAPAATWQIEWLGGNVRTDLTTGDKLVVTAENGDVKKYFIKVDGYRPSHDASLSSITWPDIPEGFTQIYGWMGDTIPNFEATAFDYKVQVPFSTVGVPALLGKNTNVNAKVVVNKATNLYGGPADRTVTFTSTAEDDTTISTYTVQLEKEKDPTDLQRWAGDPFISQFVWQDQWDNGFMEVVNPGTEVLDMSNYMFCFGYVNSPAEAISRLSEPGDSSNRYGKYIPGYKWKTGAAWAADPAVAEQDLNVNPLVYPGDVFVIGDIRTTGTSGYPWFASQQCDIDFGHTPWGGETVGAWSALKQWSGANWYLFKIDNDSVKNGTKPATDPNDFTLLDVFGSGDGSDPVVGGIAIHQIIGYTRKPEFYKGNTEYKGSFGTDEATSEWVMVDEAYLIAHNAGWPNQWLHVAAGLGSHFMDDVSVYKSTVSSNVYKVSQGFTSPQAIRGLVAETSVSSLYDKLIKADTGQVLSVKSAVNGAILEETADIAHGDTLVVLSADTKNTTKYVLSLEELSHDALLVSEDYEITVDGATGTVGGFEFGTPLKDVVAGVTAPEAATFDVIDAAGNYLPLKMLNFDTIYVDQLVNSEIFFEVVAEDGVTKINYQLTPNALESDAFVTSSVFEVDQEASLINLVPDGIATNGLLNNLVPAPGATLQLIDKLGYDRMFGNVVKDDKLVVTAQDGVTVRTYYLQMLGDISYSLAYVLSDVYSVNQITLGIWGWFDETTTVADFMANLIPAPGATLKVTDAEGVENTGTLVMGDKLVVTSGNGANTVDYSIDFPTGTDNQNQNSITVYPNPTSDWVTISGLKSGNRIRVSNIMGVVVTDKTAQLDKEVISLQGQRYGIYFITVSNADGVIGRYKMVLK